MERRQRMPVGEGYFISILRLCLVLRRNDR
jgi:hypothetical protein